jgi:hypothetical protein
MKQTPTKDVNTKTQASSASGNEVAALPVRPGRAFGGGLLPKAGVLAVLLGLPLGASLVTAGEKPHQPQYRFTEIPLPGPGYALGINDNGLVTGFYSDPVTGDAISFLYERGVLTTGLEGPGASYTALGPANNRGVEIGNDGDFTHQQAVLYNIGRGTYTPLPAIPNMPLNFGNGISDAGHAVGTAFTGGHFSGATGLPLNWIWDGEEYSFFAVPGADLGTYSDGINNRDQVSGYYVDGQGIPHGFLKDGLNFTTLDVPGAFFTVLFGLNNLGVVAGEYGDPSGRHGCTISRGQVTTVDVPFADAIASGWWNVNDHGDLAGAYRDASFAVHAVVAERVDGEGESDHAE